MCRGPGSLHHANQAWWGRLVIPGTQEMEVEDCNQFGTSLAYTIPCLKRKTNSSEALPTWVIGVPGRAKGRSAWVPFSCGIAILPPGQGRGCRKSVASGYAGHWPEAGSAVRIQPTAPAPLDRPPTYLPALPARQLQGACAQQGCGRLRERPPECEGRKKYSTRL